MSGLSDLKVKIKNQPHNLAWINDKERSVLKAMGGSGKAGPMGIPAYTPADYDDPEKDPGTGEDLDIDWSPEDPGGGWSPEDPDEGFAPTAGDLPPGPNEKFGFPQGELPTLGELGQRVDLLSTIQKEQALESGLRGTYTGALGGETLKEAEADHAAAIQNQIDALALWHKREGRR